MFFYNLINSTGCSYNRSKFSGAGFILFLTKLYKNLFEAYAVAGEKKNGKALIYGFQSTCPCCGCAMMIWPGWMVVAV